ncbi:MAG: hypothetical protein FJ297_05060, partial [Planctomycetes bacterium]|nr:hypothetical protein [Planctomycetota bacterium]
MSAREFLDRLERHRLLEDSVIADLRRQLEGASRGVSAESIAKLLVENGHITRFQATKLINEVTSSAEEIRDSRAETADAKRQQGQSVATGRAAGDEDDLIDLPPTPEEIKRAADARRAKPAPGPERGTPAPRPAPGPERGTPAPRPAPAPRP